MEVIYHYTSLIHLKDILSSGKLMVSEAERRMGVKPPALWLSTNPVWENTATKAISQNGKVRKLTKEEQHQKFGLVRFVLEFNKGAFCSWKKYKYKTNTTPEVYRHLEIDGIEQGANPDEWFVSFRNIPLHKCISYEKWNGNNWEPLLIES